MRSAEKAVADGCTIDWSAAGRPVAYKGPRFRPTHWEYVLTELEADMLRQFKSLSNFMCGGYYEPRNDEEAALGAALFKMCQEHDV